MIKWKVGICSKAFFKWSGSIASNIFDLKKKKTFFLSTFISGKHFTQSQNIISTDILFDRIHFKSSKISIWW